MITQRQAERLNYGQTSVSDATFTAGLDDGTTLQPGQVGELAVAEVGSDGKLADYLAVVVGAVPEAFKNTVKAKPEFDIQNSTPADVPKDVEVAIAFRAEGTRGSLRQLMKWRTEDDLSDVSRDLREDLNVKSPGVREGRYIQILTRSHANSFTPSFADSTFTFPIRGGVDQPNGV